MTRNKGVNAIANVSASASASAGPSTGAPGLRQNVTAASVGVAIGSIFWGLYWIPLRLLDERALSGPWAGIGLYCIAIIICLPWLWRARQTLGQRLHIIAACGMLTGAAMGLFSTGIIMTEVIRATLLFYLSPVWATILGIIFLGERLTATRFAALMLGLSGTCILLGIGLKLPLPENLGDWLSLAGGLCFAAGSLLVFRFPDISITEQVAGFMGGALVSSLLMVLVGSLFGIAALSSAPTLTSVITSWPFLLLGGLYILPLAFLVIWPAQVISPGRMTLLLMGEILVGALSAAWLAGEALSWREILGGGLIVSAGLVEVFGGKNIAAKQDR